MRDTPADVDARFLALFGEHSGGERIRMACEMFDLARALMIANIKAQEPGISDVELRSRLFSRLYGPDVTPGEPVEPGSR
mgnify:CR=1 FL=1